ncbi:hypothetical protein [Streptomyces sp. NPDC059010]|uniref:hypothetical protein n=1 Tax=Streptomyces sp. NPDC059010 TaxID=3346695 RepID=UPI0036CF4C83
MTAGRDIGVAVTGDHNRIHLAAQVRSAYQEQVRRIAPPQLIGREHELAELADFCTTDSGPAYAWWRAEAWAGKTALLSWFALHPPRGVRVVPFFVTARLGAQNDVTAYVDVVLEQFAELAGESLPAHLTSATREAHLISLYDRAAQVCVARGEHLTLLVDGLDEDRGVTTGPDAHSIASLLPAPAGAGMRVLVAGRLHPPLPADVPDGHPLRDPAIVRTLTQSPYARAIRSEAERELKRLLVAGGLEYDLLGLVTAAGGGLTADDLAELTGAAPYRVRDVLRTRAGRTFTVRASGCLLAHEELQHQAEEMLGSAELARYRDTLHDWADRWRGRGWPEGTPEYLLRGYFRMLHGCRDTTRVTRCALDAERHDRMLAVTGTDAMALEETDAAERLLDGPDHLVALLRIRIHRDAIRGRDSGFAATRAWAWAALGQPLHAQALARASRDASALALVAQEFTAQGLAERAADLAAAAESALEQERHGRIAGHVVEVHRALAGLGLHDRADAVLGTASDAVSEAGLAPRVVDVWVAHGEFERARSVALSQTRPTHRAACFRALAAGLLHTDLTGELGDAVGTATALELCTELLEGAAAGPTPSGEAAVSLLVRSGQYEAAEAVLPELSKDAAAGAARILGDALARRGEIERVLRLSRRLHPLDARPALLAAAAEGFAATGRLQEAEAVGSGHGSLEALARGAVARARAGHRAQASEFLARAEDRCRGEADRRRAISDRTRAAEAMVDAGHTEAAREILAAVESDLPPPPRIRMTGGDLDAHADYEEQLTLVIRALALAGELDRAEALMNQQPQRFTTGGITWAAAWTELVHGWIESGQYDRAEALVSGVRYDDDRDELRAVMAVAFAARGAADRAAVCLAAVGDPSVRIPATADTAGALAGRGLRDEARALLTGLPGMGGDDAPVGRDAHEESPGDTALNLAQLCRGWSAVGEPERARALADAALRMCGVTDDLTAGWRMVRALMRAGLHEKAKWFVRRLPPGDTHDCARETLAQCLAEQDEPTAALNWARPLLNDDCGLIEAARALVPVVDPVLGRTLAAHILRHGDWSHALPAVLHLEPAALPTLVESLRQMPTAARTSAPSSS